MERGSCYWSRVVAVHSEDIAEVLWKVYEADRIADELVIPSQGVGESGPRLGAGACRNWRCDLDVVKSGCDSGPLAALRVTLLRGAQAASGILIG